MAITASTGTFLPIVSPIASSITASAALKDVPSDAAFDEAFDEASDATSDATSEPSSDIHTSDTGLQRITAVTVPGNRRTAFLPRVFGRQYVRGEATVYNWMGALCAAYRGGFWDFVELSNGSFYMRLSTDKRFQVQVEGNGFDGELSADAASILACLFALNHLLHAGREELIDAYEGLRDFAFEHAEAKALMQAID